MRDMDVLWRSADTDISGVYRATVGAHPREHLLAVNVPMAADRQQRSESDLTRTTEEELKKLYPEADFQIVRDPGDAVRKGEQFLLSSAAELQVPQLGNLIARWILLLAFALLVAEGVLAWYFGHYSAVHERDTIAMSRHTAAWFHGTVTALVCLLAFSFVVGVGVLIHAVATGDFLGFLPGSWRRGVEEAMGVPEPAAGEGSLWHLEFQPFLKDAAADLWLAPLLGVAVAVLVICLYRREGRVFTV